MWGKFREMHGEGEGIIGIEILKRYQANMMNIKLERKLRHIHGTQSFSLILMIKINKTRNNAQSSRQKC